MLAVGRLNVRKNLERLIVALAGTGLIHPGFPLVIVGQENGFTTGMPSLESASGSVIRTGFVSDAHLRWLYAHCATFAFPSLDEGFGLPILEAAYSAAPMATSAIPAFEEFGAIGSFFDPLDTDAIAVAVRESMAHGVRAGADKLASRFRGEPVLSSSATRSWTGCEPMKRSRLRELIDRYYKASRGLDAGVDARLSSREIAASVARRATERLRGVVRHRAGTFIARGVTIRNGTKLRLGRTPRSAPASRSMLCPRTGSPSAIMSPSTRARYCAAPA